MQIPKKSILSALQGVAQATKTPEENTDQIKQLFASHYTQHVDSNSTTHTNGDATDERSFDDWNTLVKNNTLNLDDTALHIARLALAISLLRETCRQNQPASPKDLDQIWGIIHDALTSKNLSRNLFTANRSAQGLLAVPLCSLLKDGSIDELFRLHVWMPDGKRANPDFALHSHQPFAQSWILAGEARDHAYQVDPVDDIAEATHAGYALAWNDGKGQNRNYKTHQSYSIVQNTGKFFKATETSTERHARNDSYSIPAAAFHATEVAPDALHATLFYFDSHRGFVKDAGVLGPKDGESYTQFRDPAGITPAELAEVVEAARSESS
ncbi:uncharacterized protein CTRU02_210568 [Colletotrichum truncatum]|uniref:Uncharacterized protein n=1 Tax=Colletotrichum truncatum TaxID=5467 RepID=A0ACC3YPE7_COLTU|nr:uncharacterized protein CTRU02_12771 [Colletotrichum truncatum]KAF6784242.1 hypothetical protein CTRU02_12771 [Colletotrichum truncatum]